MSGKIGPRSNSPDTGRHSVILFAAGGKIPPNPPAEQALETIFNPAATDADMLEAMKFPVGEPKEIPTAWKVYACRSAIRFATFIGECHHVFSVHLVVQSIEAKVWAIPSLCRATPSAISEHLVELLGSSPIPRSLLLLAFPFN
jgi:hypothetical protein